MRTSLWVMVCGALVLAAGVPILAAQAAAAGVGVPAPTPGNETVAAFIWAYISSALLQVWKRSKYGPMSESALAWTNRGIAMLVAAAGALGVHASFDAAAGTLTVSGLLWPGVWTAIADTIRQGVFQQFIYRTAVQRPGEGA